MALTKKQIDALAYDPEGPKRQIHYDRGDVPGFGLMISPKGRKTLVLRYRPEGSLHPVLHTIGPYGTFTLQ
ncbi:MAG: Arm DNA-binding domain-containing protein, partial [Gemmatimonadota bacterium]|nr:Arm DNA-binding domain-containing protein [Gemmatimonadota bacterium]